MYSRVLPRKTVLQIAPPGRPSDAVSERHFARVRTLEPTSGQAAWTEGADQGWVWRCDILNLSALSREELAKQPPTHPRRVAQANVPNVLMGLEPEEIQQAWRQVQADVVENEGLSAPKPEPYFARAELLTRIGVQEEALRDYLTATALVKHSSRSPVTYARYFLQLHDALQSRTRQPRPPYYGAAWEHYAQGYHCFWRGDLASAVQHFDNAIQLGPDAALFYYYRALTYKRLGKDHLAQGDVVAGVHLEHRLYDPTRAETPDSPQHSPDVHISTQLERVQGPLRLWLEDYRSGIAAFRNRVSNASSTTQEPLP